MLTPTFLHLWDAFHSKACVTMTLAPGVIVRSSQRKSRAAYLNNSTQATCGVQIS